jgi:hypothetical protein
MLVTKILKSGDDWALYHVPFVAENKDHYVSDLNIAHKNFKDVFKNADSSLTRKQDITLGDLPVILNGDQNINNFIEDEMNSADDLSGYSFYNVYSLTTPSPYFYELYRILKSIVRMHLGENRMIWMQSWMNFQNSDNVLDWHNHTFPYHGYVSIDPYNTTTKFRNNETKEIVYEIENHPGQIYFGPGFRPHKVFANEQFSKPRITLGFDILLDACPPDSSFSMFPLL